MARKKKDTAATEKPKGEESEKKVTVKFKVTKKASNDEGAKLADAAGAGVRSIITRNIDGILDMLAESETQKGDIGIKIKIDKTLPDTVLEVTITYGKPTKDKVIARIGDPNQGVLFESAEEWNKHQIEDEPPLPDEAKPQVEASDPSEQ